MDGYSFKINFRNQILKVIVNHNEINSRLKDQNLTVFVNNVLIEPTRLALKKKRRYNLNNLKYRLDCNVLLQKKQ
jgi:trehalose/maltose hydrolase-like predicted phosphorylase